MNVESTNAWCKNRNISIDGSMSRLVLDGIHGGFYTIANNPQIFLWGGMVLNPGYFPPPSHDCRIKD